MDSSETYMDVKFTQPYPRSRSLEALTSLYSELNIVKGGTLMNEDADPLVASVPGEPPISAQTDGPFSTYSVLNLPKDEHLMEEYEDPRIASGYAEISVAVPAGEQKQKPTENIGNRPDRKTRLLCLVISILIAIVAGLSIHVSQIRHKFTEMETKYRSNNETKAQICELLNSRREQSCSEDWFTNKDRCYYVSTFETTFHRAMQECSNRDSRLLEFNSRDEAVFVSHKLVYRNRTYWIGKCEDGNVDTGLLYNMSFEATACRKCDPYGRRFACNRDERFICEKPAPLIPDFPENIRGLCQQTVEAT